METLKIKFLDFWGGFNYTDNFITDILKKKYILEFSDQPDYIFCSVFGRECLKYDAVRICFTGENVHTDFNIYDYGIGFDWFDAGDRYLRFPLYALYKDDFMKVAMKHEKVDSDFFRLHNRFCNFVYSNASNVMPQREELLNILNEYKIVDCGGKYRNNVGGPVADKMEFLSKYKFTIAVENTSTPGYTTEKIMHALAAGTIPIYYGNPMIGKEFNTKAFINCHDYQSFEDVLEYVRYLDNNDEAYLEMMKTPVFSETSCGQNYMTDVLLESFLLQIVASGRENAYRRDRYGWGKVYENRCRREDKVSNSVYGKIYGKLFYKQ